VTCDAQKLISSLDNVEKVLGLLHELGEETIASYLYQVHLYHWLKSNGYGRWLADNDL
jgi:hypothetical protein